VQATVEPEFEKPCITYITQVQISGSWLGNSSVQVRCYRKARAGRVQGAFLGARVLTKEGEDAPWQSIESFDTGGGRELVLGSPEVGVRATLVKSAWFPKKAKVAEGSPTAGGRFTLILQDTRNTAAAKVEIRQDLPGQEHLNLAIKHLSALGRLDVGGLLGFDKHPENLEYASAECNHHRATTGTRIESQENNPDYYYTMPPWKRRWEKIRRQNQKQSEASVEEVSTVPTTTENDAAASLIKGNKKSKDHDVDVDVDSEHDSDSSLMCKCASAGGPFDEGVLVRKQAATFASASWD